MTLAKKVLVTRKLPKAVEQRLREHYRVQLNESDKPLSQSELQTAMTEFDALVTTVSDQIDTSVLQQPSAKVQMIANVGVGYSNIDLITAHACKIIVSNTPDVLTDATADIALLLILSSTRRAYEVEKALRSEQWSGFSLVKDLGTSLQGKTLGIIGMGSIGQATARRACLGFGMQVVYCNRSSAPELDFHATKMDSIQDVMKQSDVVSVHVPGGGEFPVVTSDHINSMKPTAHLVNTARGDSIDQSALIRALQEGRIAGAGLDVYEDEPRVPEALRQMNNVTLLPHIGSATTEVRTAMGMLAVDNLDAFFRGENLPSKVV